jgi:ABC-2 type transport system ATP-binding protein
MVLHLASCILHLVSCILYPVSCILYLASCIYPIMNPIIQTENLSKWYGDVIGINDVTLTINAGVTGLLGPNGAGKSTLLKLMTGQLKPKKGRLTVLGKPVWNNPELNRQLGYCPDQDSFYEFMTGFQFVQFLATLHGYSPEEVETRVLKAIETVGLLEAKDKRIGAYSKGMRQRIKLAQALVHDPELLFLDEPLAGMDPVGRRRTIRLVKDLAATGISIIVSSHVLHEVEAMTDTILLIHHGRILAEGNISDIRELIDEHPHKVYLRCDKPRLLASVCVGFESVASVEFESTESGVVIETRKPDEFYSHLPEIVIENEIQVEQLYSPDDNLQAVFKYLVD